ncbi:MAG TPA: lytic transglycosylase domain-containing protein [Microvirga sp.]|nr:lytic transglycosylase domain-containing protein [Microvirga sp.]
MISRVFLGCACAVLAFPALAADRSSLDALISQHANAHGIPESLVHHVVRKESNYNPRAANRGNYGLMQIRHGTARGLGYTGSAAGLLDANTNLTYAVAYLANAYRVAGGNPSRAVALYQRGFYYEAKRKGMLDDLRTAAARPAETAQPVAVAAQPAASSWFTGSALTTAPAQPVAAVADATGEFAPAFTTGSVQPHRARAVRASR